MLRPLAQKRIQKEREIQEKRKQQEEKVNEQKTEINQEQKIQQVEYLNYMETFYKYNTKPTNEEHLAGSQRKNIKDKFGIEINKGICGGIAGQRIIIEMQHSNLPPDPFHTSPLQNKEAALKAVVLQQEGGKVSKMKEVLQKNLPDTVVILHERKSNDDHMKTIDQQLKTNIFKTLQDDKARANYIVVEDSQSKVLHALMMTVKKTGKGRISCEATDANYGSLVSNEVSSCWRIAEKITSDLPKNTFASSPVTHTQLLEVENNKPSRKL